MKVKPRVLVVDTDKNILAALQIALEFEGYQITSCGTTKEAIRYALGSRVDAVVTQIPLDYCAGTCFDFLRDMQILLPHVPIVVTSDELDAKLEERVRSMGIKDVTEETNGVTSASKNVENGTLGMVTAPLFFSRTKMATNLDIDHKRSHNFHTYFND